MTADTALTLRSPADLIAAVPYLLGFHPADSLTVIAIRDQQVIFAARHDLADPATPDDVADAEARHVAVLVDRQGAQGAAVIGHGVEDRVTPAVLRLGAALQRLGVPVLDVLRVTDGRFWSYLCDEPSCCPSEGTPCDPASSVVAAAATYAGQVALPDRGSLAARLRPVEGAARAAMIAASRRAEQRLAALQAAIRTGASPREPDGTAFGRQVRRVGGTAIRAAFRRYRAGGVLGNDEAAWLAVLLAHLPVRDYAWERISDEPWQVELWSDILRRVQAAQVPPVACLLAFAAWRSGQGALAAVAVDRARAQDPDYPMAVLLDDVLRYALPPSAVDDWPARGRPPHHRSSRRGRRR